MSSVISKVERFEDLIAWQKARILTQAIYQITRQSYFSELVSCTYPLTHRGINSPAGVRVGAR